MLGCMEGLSAIQKFVIQINKLLFSYYFMRFHRTFSLFQYIYICTCTYNVHVQYICRSIIGKFANNIFLRVVNGRPNYSVLIIYIHCK